MDINSIGAWCFGVVTGYIAYRSLARTVDKASLSDLATVLGVVGGAVVTTLFDPSSDLFGWYAVGLLLGMAVFFLLFLRMNGKEELGRVMGGATLTRTTDRNDANGPRL